ncbi:hypothetical protein [Limibacillus halophilus]|uniref:Uncharacterized protein n=1 Tax=Limibacillus halophilus TaxID=1579333 RepID=A0A839SXS3_9PROT|nr:hypothetical protein [Limibacillus halophilus]MBB3066470.1 hypothetical protein [Limibacillus halophilus]
MRLTDPSRVARLRPEEQIGLFAEEQQRLSPISPSQIGFLEAGGKSKFEPMSPADLGFRMTGAALDSAKRAVRGEQGGSQAMQRAFEDSGFSFQPEADAGVSVAFDPARVQGRNTTGPRPTSNPVRLTPLTQEAPQTTEAAPVQEANAAPGEKPGDNRIIWPELGPNFFGGGGFSRPRPTPQKPAARPPIPVPNPTPEEAPGTQMPSQSEDGEAPDGDSTEEHRRRMKERAEQNEAEEKELQEEFGNMEPGERSEECARRKEMYDARCRRNKSQQRRDECLARVEHRLGACVRGFPNVPSMEGYFDE